MEKTNHCFFSILILFIITIFCTSAVSASDDTEWCQFQKDWTQTGLINCSAPFLFPELVWEFESEYGFNVMPIIHEDMAYGLSSHGNVYALNRHTGELVWSATTKDGLMQTSIPAYGDGKLFVAINDETNSGYLFAFNGTTGKELWNVSVTSGNFACPLTYYDHRLYIGEGLKGGVKTKNYYCYQDDGTFLWSYPTASTAGFLWNGASVIGDYIVYPTHEGKIVCLCRENGTFFDEVDLTKDVSFARSDLGRIRASVAYHDGYIYTTSETTYTSGFIWRIGFDSLNGKFIDDGWNVFRDFSTSTPVIYEGKVYVGQGEHGYTGEMLCLNASDGAELWAYPVDGGVKSSPAVCLQGDDIYIYFTEAIPDGAFYCVKGDGTLAWEYNPPADTSYILQGASISDGKVYFGTGAGNIYAFQEMAPTIPVADFTANVTYGYDTLAVSFTDMSTVATSWEWDFDGDGFVDSTEQNPIHFYASTGAYNVSLKVGNIYGNGSEVKSSYIFVDDDWNPWNDPESDGDEMITFAEVMEAYNCFVNQTGAPKTGVDIDFATVMVMYNAFVSQTPM
ncbi:PQQ-binding-like beta-propeller repeat protein [Methanolobus sp. ZRKC2]|uniref:outer membrane protein assembly factor BamB family protein n=1 Tax=Methanolobus sp. ZRKC2 TaxID=3125783 RepID=UPI00324B829D